tara:strand:+ start:47 stop:529 length:483 start_codon:yes stop_codon:yes gene_type:complete
MKRFKDFIKESLDTIFPYEKIRDEKQSVEHESGPPSEIHHIHHEITLPDKSKVTVEKRITPDFFRNNKPEMSVQFKAGGSQELTGKGKYQFGILNTVSHITDETAKKYGVNSVNFALAKGGDDETRRRRHSVYSRVVKRKGKGELPPIDRYQRIEMGQEN